VKDKKIVVLMGGPSAETEVSLNTGKAILAALKEKGYNAEGMELDPHHLVGQLQESHCDIVFNAVHGKFGEDGVLQGVLEMIGMPYTGSGVLASAVTMDKVVSKNIFMARGISTPRSQSYIKEDQKRDLIKEIMQEFSLPVVVKSAAQGSSIGVSIVTKQENLQQALATAFEYSNDVLIEEFIKGRELTVAVWGNPADKQALPIIEIVPHSGTYDYQSKYTKGATEYIVPAKLDAELTKSVQELAVRTFAAAGCSGIARVDLMLDKDNIPYVLEVNSVPGMTATSLVPKAAQALGIEFPDLCEKLLAMVNLD
jgi:D-alanine--D-alanine ligase